jgi:cyanophycinase
MKTIQSNECPIPKGILVVIGGHENKGEDPETISQKENPNPLEILESFIKLIPAENPTVEVITSASGEGAESFQDYLQAFSALGVESIQQIHHYKRGDVLNDESLLERSGKADAFFFTGGDQLKLTTLYGGTPFLTFLKQRYIKENIVIAGTSAGAMALSTPMIYAGNDQKQQIAGEIKVTTGLEFIKDVCVDTHFTDRNRFLRVSQVIASNPGCIAVGISEDTAMIVRNGRDIEIAGSGIVVVINGSELTSSNILDFGDKVPFAAQGLKIDFLVRGNTYTLPLFNPPHI